MIRARVNAAANQVFHVIFTDDNGFMVETQRSFNDLSLLSKSLQSDTKLDICLDSTADAEQIEDYLNYWLNTITEDPLVLDILVKFMENESSGSAGSNLQVRFLLGKVCKICSITFVNISY